MDGLTSWQLAIKSRRKCTDSTTVLQTLNMPFMIGPDCNACSQYVLRMGHVLKPHPIIGFEEFWLGFFASFCELCSLQAAIQLCLKVWCVWNATTLKKTEELEEHQHEDYKSSSCLSRKLLNTPNLRHFNNTFVYIVLPSISQPLYLFI